jgi:Holliday junction resolvase RusA-like endonuclease
MRRLEIVAYGRAAPQGSKKGGSAGNMMEASRFLPTWRIKVYAEAVKARKAHPDGIWAPITGACQVDIVVSIDRPLGTQFPDFPAGEPDADKLARAILDSLTGAQVYVDDSRVVDLRIRKVWADSLPGLGARGAKIIVTDLSGS